MNTTQDPAVPTNVSLPLSYRAKIEYLEHRTGRSRSHLMRKAIDLLLGLYEVHPDTIDEADEPRDAGDTRGSA